MKSVLSLHMQPFISTCDASVCNTHGILEAKQQDLQLADGCAVEVQLQLELRERVGNDFPVCHANKISQTDHKGGDVLTTQLHFLGALLVRSKG